MGGGDAAMTFQDIKWPKRHVLLSTLDDALTKDLGNGDPMCVDFDMNCPQIDSILQQKCQYGMQSFWDDTNLAPKF